MDVTRTLESLLAAALSEPSVVRARHLISSVIQDAKTAIANGGDHQDLSRIACVAYGHLAGISDDPTGRARYRALGLGLCSRALKANPTSAALATTYANAAVDWFYDSFATVDADRLRSTLATARKNCERLLRSEPSTELRVHLLVQSASILRCQAKLHHKVGGAELAHKAERASEAACTEDPASSLARLDRGLSAWAAARFAEDEATFVNQVNDAEASLIEAHTMGLPLATLCLARLSRQTYRPAQAIVWFSKYEAREHKRRIVLAESHLVGEAAVLLIHRQVDPEYRKATLQYADQLLSEAEQAGYNNARVLLALARIRTELGDRPGSLVFLHQIARQGSTDWTLAVEKARHAIEADDLPLLHRAFALGLSDGAVWNSLGTFAKEVLDDTAFAIRLYQTGLRLNPHSAIIHTNLARLYLKSNDATVLPETKRHLELARRYADFSFRWWKPLSEELDKRANNDAERVRSYQPTTAGRDTLDQIYKEFLELEHWSDQEHLRGKKFSELFERVLKLSFGTRNVAGSLIVDGVQSDATFKYGANVYRVEMSWDSRPNDRTEVDKIIVRLERTPYGRGLLVSMSGFTDTVHSEVVRERSHQHIILLIDREEFRNVLRGEIRLESLIEEKEAQVYGLPIPEPSLVTPDGVSPPPRS